MGIFVKVLPWTYEKIKLIKFLRLFVRNTKILLANYFFKVIPLTKWNSFKSKQIETAFIKSQELKIRSLTLWEKFRNLIAHLNTCWIMDKLHIWISLTFCHLSSVNKWNDLNGTVIRSNCSLVSSYAFLKLNLKVKKCSLFSE